MSRHLIQRHLMLGLMLALLLLTAGGTPLVRARDDGPDQRTTCYERQIAAAQWTKICLDSIKELRLAKGIPIDPRLDPNETGIVGKTFSEITTCVGALTAKRTATNPNFAALFVRYFTDLGLRQGDVVAIGATASYPGLIVAALAAARELGLEPILVHSLGSSQYGANIPALTFVDMLEHLNEEGLLPYRLAAVTLEIDGDNGGVGLLNRDPASFRQIIARAEVPALQPASCAESIRRCREIYERCAAGRPIRCFVNLGAGRPFVGELAIIGGLPEGLTVHAQIPQNRRGHALMLDYAARGIPVISLINVKRIAEETVGVDPIPMPPIGAGPVYRVGPHPPLGGIPQ